MILFTRNLKTLHITGPYKVSAPLIRCDAEDILPAHWLVFPPGPLCPRWDVTQAKHKAVFHGAAAYLASESMWDMPENKGASLRQLTGWAYPFHGPHIAPPPPGLAHSGGLMPVFTRKGAHLEGPNNYVEEVQKTQRHNSQNANN